MVNRSKARGRLRMAFLIALVGVVSDVNAEQSARELRRETRLQTARELALCAAYYLKVSNASPMSEFESLYSAGERAINRARRITGDRKLVDEMMVDAANDLNVSQGLGMAAELEQRYGVRCDELVGRFASATGDK